MNPAQQQLMQSQANLNNALANRISGGAQGCGRCRNAFAGNRCPQHQCGPVSHCGMNGARGCGFDMGGWFGNTMGNLFSPFGGHGGPQFGPHAEMHLGISLRA
ncbi:MAG: hypothetical protein AB7S38_10690 [Vulcanimicrobiota bacterium]